MTVLLTEGQMPECIGKVDGGQVGPTGVPVDDFVDVQEGCRVVLASVVEAPTIQGQAYAAVGLGDDHHG